MSAPPIKKTGSASASSQDSGLVGAKLRTLRKARGLTLQEVSATTGVSVGHLSQLERDLASPSIKTLRDISLALGVSISWFFDDGSGPRPGSKYVIRDGQRRHIRFAQGIDDYQLNSEAIKQLGLLYSVFEPGASSGEHPYTHEGEEAGYLVSGQLELWIDGEAIALTAGDSFSFPSTCRHRYRNTGSERTIVIWAMTPPSY